MATPNQMFTHKMNVVKGWPSQTALDKSLPVDFGADEAIALSGRVGSINPVTKKIVLGCPDGAVPLFLWPSATEFTTSTGADTGNIAQFGNRKGSVGLVGLDAFEMAVTEFVSGQTYDSNTPLAVVNTNGSADKGKITPGAFYTQQTVGIVSDGQGKNAYGVEAVTFWSYFLPKHA